MGKGNSEILVYQTKAVHIFFLTELNQDQVCKFKKSCLLIRVVKIESFGKAIVITVHKGTVKDTTVLNY